MEVKGSAVAEQPVIDPAQMSDEELAAQLNPPKPTPAPTPVAEDTVAKVEVAKTPDTPIPAETPEAEKVELKVDLESENAKLRKQLDHLRQVFGRQSNELGELRKTLKSRPTAEEYDQDPVKASEQLQEHREQLRQIAEKEQAQQLHATAIQNMEFIAQFAPDLNANAETIRHLLTEEDKLPESDIQRLFSEIYLQNPWGVYQLNQRARASAQIKALKAEVEKLKKAPKEVADRIAGVSKIASNVKASTGNASSAPASGISDAELAAMDDEALKQHLENLRKG